MWICEQLRGKLIVSCQAWPGDPLDDIDAIRRMALAALRSGAAGLRINSPEHIAALRKETGAPIIGLQKRRVDGAYRITPDLAAARALAEAGASIIAVDCTARNWSEGEPWQGLIGAIHDQLHLPVMADVATLDEAIAAERAGADFVGPTMYGATPYTQGAHSFNWSLLECMRQYLAVPIIAEGHIGTPEDARRAIACGALCVVVGSAITRPGDITAGFLRGMMAGSSRSPVVGVDLGGTSIKAGLVARDGGVSCIEQQPTNVAGGSASVLAGLMDVIEAVLERARAQGEQPVGLGMASAGAIHPLEGTVFAATANLPDWVGVPLRHAVTERFHLPTFAVNDAQAAALADLYFGAGSKLTDFVALTLGTGVGGGIVAGGKLLTGQYGIAGSIGHQTLRSDGKPCNCGRKGCLEAYVSTAALIETYRRHAQEAPVSGESTAALARRISERALVQEAAASAAYAELGGYLAEGIANLFNILDPQAVILSGGLVAGQQRFVQELEERVRGLLHYGTQRQPCVQLAKAGHQAGIQGAAALAFTSLG